jgi:hypothetical protein
VSEWLLFNANSAFIPQLYHGENKLIFQLDDDEVRFVLEQHAKLDFYSASSLKHADRHVARTHYSDSEPTSLLFLLSTAC